MLALAANPSHDHASTYGATVTAVSAPQPARSKPIARRAASVNSLKSAARNPLTATSSTSSNTILLPPKLSRSGALPPRPRSEVLQSSKPDSVTQNGPQPSPMNVAQTVEEPEHPPIFLDEPHGPSRLSQPRRNVNIDDCSTPDLLRNLAALLTDMATANDTKTSRHSHEHGHESRHESRTLNHDSPIWDSLFTASQTALSSKSSPLTFHARNIPTISLEAYLMRILRYCPTTNEVFLSLLVYFDRLSRLSEEATGSRFLIDSYNVHRLVIAGVTVASKFFSDVFYTNSRYAKVGGLPQSELNQLELQFLLLIDFRLVISSDEMQYYAQQLVEYSQRQPDLPLIQFQSMSEPLMALPMARSRPMHSMGAFDAFGGNIQNDQVARPSSNTASRNATTPKRATAISHIAYDAPPRETSEERDQESSVYSETDTDAETDDEPTIKPSHSCASSDTQSLFSNDASEASFDPNNEEDDGSATDDEHRTPERERSHHRRWDSRGSASADSNRLMASP